MTCCPIRLSIFLYWSTNCNLHFINILLMRLNTSLQSIELMWHDQFLYTYWIKFKNNTYRCQLDYLNIITKSNKMYISFIKISVILNVHLNSTRIKRLGSTFQPFMIFGLYNMTLKRFTSLHFRWCVSVLGRNNHTIL